METKGRIRNLSYLSSQNIQFNKCALKEIFVSVFGVKVFWLINVKGMMELEDHICKSEQTIYLIPEHSKLALLMLQKKLGGYRLVLNISATAGPNLKKSCVATLL